MPADNRPRCEHQVVFPMDNCTECIKLNFQEKLTTLEKVLERCSDTRAVLLAQRDRAEHLNASFKNLLCQIAYPQRGTEQECMNIQDAANLIQGNFSLQELSEDERRPMQIGVTVGRDRPNQKLVYNKQTKKIDIVRGTDGLVIDSFDPPELSE